MCAGEENGGQKREKGYPPEIPKKVDVLMGLFSKVKTITIFIKKWRLNPCD